MFSVLLSVAAAAAERREEQLGMAGTGVDYATNEGAQAFWSCLHLPFYECSMQGTAYVEAPSDGEGGTIRCQQCHATAGGWRTLLRCPAARHAYLCICFDCGCVACMRGLATVKGSRGV